MCVTSSMSQLVNYQPGKRHIYIGFEAKSSFWGTWTHLKKVQNLKKGFGFASLFNTPDFWEFGEGDT